MGGVIRFFFPFFGLIWDCFYGFYGKCLNKITKIRGEFSNKIKTSKTFKDLPAL